ncbi:MAG: right-handed parallel beta-helix repeat-containing protein [Spirosomaceae bacterium]|nr:right-handed parallel beta-helix repeat-containing protein [Spirosomataceae bacterium]
MPNKFIQFLFFGVLFSSFHGVSQQPQIGDAGWIFDESRYDVRFPNMKEWAKAGVQGGIPPRGKLPVKQKISPKDNLQMAIDQVAAEGGGVILLTKGDYLITQTISLKSGVVLRGEDKNQTILKVTMKKMFFKYAPDGKQLTAIEVNDAERVGFEDLTIRYAAVDFEPYDKNDFNAAWDRRVFHEHETRDTTLFVHLLIFRRCRNAWVDNCNLLWAGAHPLGLGECEHITCRNNFIDRAYVKKDSFHGGYYGCWGSRYCLFYNEKVRRIRHFAMMNKGAAYNVVYRCDFETDVNFHHEDDGHNLVEQCRIATPVWHSWDAIGVGAANKHRPPGPGNLLLNNEAISKGVAGYDRKMGAAQPNVVYEVVSQFLPSKVFIHSNTPPVGGTLYAIKNLK